MFESLARCLWSLENVYIDGYAQFRIPVNLNCRLAVLYLPKPSRVIILVLLFAFWVKQAIPSNIAHRSTVKIKRGNRSFANVYFFYLKLNFCGSKSLLFLAIRGVKKENILKSPLLVVRSVTDFLFYHKIVRSVTDFDN